MTARSRRPRGPSVFTGSMLACGLTGAAGAMVTYLSTRSAVHLVAVVAVWTTVLVMCVAGLRWQHEWLPRAHVTGTVDVAVPAEGRGPDRARALSLMALTMFSLALTASLMIKVPGFVVPALVVVIAAPAVALVILAMVLRDVYRRRAERADGEDRARS